MQPGETPRETTTLLMRSPAGSDIPTILQLGGPETVMPDESGNLPIRANMSRDCFRRVREGSAKAVPTFCVPRLKLEESIKFMIRPEIIVI